MRYIAKAIVIVACLAFAAFGSVLNWNGWIVGLTLFMAFMATASI